MLINEKTKILVNKLNNSIIDEPIDELMIPLINAINEFIGITTDVCCEGHNISFPYLFFCIDGSMESLSGLGIIAHAVKSLDWVITIQSMGNEKKQFYFSLTPIKTFAYSLDSKIIKIKASEEVIKFERNKILELAEKIYFYAQKKEQSSLRKPILKSIEIKY